MKLAPFLVVEVLTELVHTAMWLGYPVVHKYR